MKMRDLLRTTAVYSPADATGVALAGSNLDQVAASLIVPKPVADATRKKQGQQPETDVELPPAQDNDDDDDTEDKGSSGDTSEEVGRTEDLGGQPDEDDFDPFDQEGSSDDDTQGDEDDASSDAQKFTVKVDGQDVEVTLDALMRSYAGTQAIERRLQEATESRNAVEQERTALNSERAAFQAETQATREAFVHGIQAMKALIAAPQVKRPDPAMRQTDPTRYALAMTDFQQDQERIRMLESEVDAKLTEYNTHKAQQLEQVKQAESAKLAQAMPVLLDPQKGPVVQKRIAAAAAKAGFTPQEIMMAADHRLFVMAAAAGEYWRMMDKQKAAREQATRQHAKASTVVSANGGQVATAKGRAQTAMANKVNKARETGDVRDVAATLIVPKPKVRR